MDFRTAFDASLTRDEMFVMVDIFKQLEIEANIKYLRSNIESDYEDYIDLMEQHYSLQQIKQDYITEKGWYDEDIINIQKEISELFVVQREIMQNIQSNEQELRNSIRS